MSTPNFALLNSKIKTAPVKAPIPGDEVDFSDLNQIVKSAPDVPPPAPEARSISGFGENILSSAGRLAKGIGDVASTVGSAVMQPFDPTKIASGIGKTAIEISAAPSAAWDAIHEGLIKPVFQQLADRYGGWENIKKTAYEDLIGMAADASMILGGLGGGLKIAGKVGQLGELSEAASTISKIGEYADPVQNALKLGGAAVNLGGRGASRVLGLTSAKDPALIRASYAKHSSEFSKAAEGKTPFSEILNNVKQAYSEVVKNRGADYKSALGSLKGQVDKLPAKQALADSFEEHHIGVTASFPNASAEAELGTAPKIKSVRVTGADDILDLLENRKMPDGTSIPKKATIRPNYSQSVIRNDSSAVSRINDVFNDIKSWTDMSALGADRLRQGIFNSIPKAARDVEGAVPTEDVASSVLKNIHGKLEDSLMTDVPGYADTIRSYRDSTRFLNEFKDDLLGRTNGGAIKKLQSASSQDQEYQRMLIDALDTKTGSKLRDQLGGFAMSQVQPRYSRAVWPILYGMVRGFSPLSLVEMAATSPSAVYRASNIAGKISRGVGAVAKPFAPLATAPVYRPLTLLPAAAFPPEKTSPESTSKLPVVP